MQVSVDGRVLYTMVPDVDAAQAMAQRWDSMTEAQIGEEIAVSGVQMQPAI